MHRAAITASGDRSSLIRTQNRFLRFDGQQVLLVARARSPDFHGTRIMTTPILGVLNMRRLSLETAVALPQIVSALIMVVTLLYAVTQWARTVSYTTQELEYNLYGRLHEMDLLLAESGDLADIVLRAGSDPQSLTSPERARFLAYENNFYNTWNALYGARESGLIGARQFGLWEEFFITASARRPKFGWTDNLHNYTPPLSSITLSLTRIGNEVMRRLCEGIGSRPPLQIRSSFQAGSSPGPDLVLINGCL